LASKTYGNKRQSVREALRYYLKVIDLETGKKIGRVGDITKEGMMLFGNEVLDKDKTYRVRVILTSSIFDINLGNLDINVQIRWSRPDANPSLVLTGMLFLNLSQQGEKIVKNLISKIGMNNYNDEEEVSYES
jgi:hypothetical protein